MPVSQIRIAAIYMVALFGCSKQYDDLSNRIPFETFSLSGTGCEWVVLGYPHDSEVIVINSLKELENYITCSGEGNIPTIDFSQHTLLLARGVTPYNNRATIKQLQQSPNRAYVMNIGLDPNLGAVITNWRVAIVTKKLVEGEKVQLHIECSE